MQKHMGRHVVLAATWLAYLLVMQLPGHAHSSRFVANPASRLVHKHRHLIEQLWKVRSACMCHGAMHGTLMH